VTNLVVTVACELPGVQQHSDAIAHAVEERHVRPSGLTKDLRNR
jgi:hypothetical protein